MAFGKSRNLQQREKQLVLEQEGSMWIHQEAGIASYASLRIARIVGPVNLSSKEEEEEEEEEECRAEKKQTSEKKRKLSCIALEHLA